MASETNVNVQPERQTQRQRERREKQKKRGQRRGVSCWTAPAYHGYGRLERAAGRSILLDSRSESRAIDKSMKPTGEDNEALETAGNALFICWQAGSSVILDRHLGLERMCKVRWLPRRSHGYKIHAVPAC
jgi:hypothetical protein